jgi:pimeloyl-ACP methyl ester carboxylesterase
MIEKTKPDNIPATLLKHLLPAIMILIIASGCHKESDITGYKYLVDYRQESLLLNTMIEPLLEALSDEYPEMDAIAGNAQYSVQIFKIAYNTHYKTDLVTASGLVCIPLADESFPVLSFQNGTNTKHGNAPTADPLNFNYFLLEMISGNGYIVLIPDYLGFGESKNLLHPYYQRESTNNAIIDLMNACHELMQQKEVLATSNGTNYLMGYSQGGWATLSVLDDLENRNSDGHSVAAVSCGAGAYDLIAMSIYVLSQDTFPGPLYLPYFIYSQQQYGSLTDPLDKYFQEPYAGIIPDLFDGSYSNGEINSQLTDSVGKLVTEDLRNNFATGESFLTLRTLLSENSVIAWNTNTKIHIYHGTNDINVPPAQSLSLYNNFLSTGVNPSDISHIELDGLTHESGIIPWGIMTINWFNELESK